MASFRFSVRARDDLRDIGAYTLEKWDADQALARAYGESPRFRDEISVHRIQRGIDKTVRFSADEMLTAVEQDMELR